MARALDVARLKKRLKDGTPVARLTERELEYLAVHGLGNSRKQAGDELIRRIILTVDYRIKEWMKEEQMRYESNGGGFFAYFGEIAREGGHNIFFRVTDPDSPGAPLKLREPCSLSYFDEDAKGVVEHFTRDFPSMAAMIDWFNTAEYLLPHNGEGWPKNGWDLGSEDPRFGSL